MASLNRYFSQFFCRYIRRRHRSLSQNLAFYYSVRSLAYMDFYYVYSKLFLEFSACIYNIILQIFLTFRYNGNSKSNMFFRRLINYVIYATSFDIASTLIISSFNNINYGLALVMYCLQTVLTIFVSY